jgi:hypothetical protein
MTKSILLTLTGSMLLSSFAFAQVPPASANINGKANIVTPLTLVGSTDLNFGDFTASGVGTLTMQANGNLTPTGLVTPLTSAGYTAHTVGVVTVGGRVGSSYTLNFPSAITLNGVPTGTMSLDSFNTNNDAPTTLLAASNTVHVGGVLHVTAAQPVGSYSGIINMTAIYN